MYLELRTTPRTGPGVSKEQYVMAVLDCVDAFGAEKMSTYMILSVDRRNTAVEAMEVVDLAIRYQPRGIVGIDLCGNPLKGDVSIFREAFARADASGLKLTLHFAEVLASSSEMELRTLLSYNPVRIGHVIHVPKSIDQEIRDRKIGIELCLSCNVHAKLIEGGISDHHFGVWLGSTNPIALCVSLLLLLFHRIC